jgi:hypothetical protein
MQLWSILFDSRKRNGEFPRTPSEYGFSVILTLVTYKQKLRSHIIASSRSPLKGYWQDPRVEYVAIDFLEPLDSIIEKMRPFCSEVTHAYFTSYVHDDNFDILKEKNVPLFQNFLRAIDTVAGENLQRVCLQTGGKVSPSAAVNSVL